jgi:hypothetical protein
MTGEGKYAEDYIHVKHTTIMSVTRDQDYLKPQQRGY